MTTAVISFREFLEAFLIIGVFLGISKKLNLKKELEIGLAAAIGVIFSLLLATGTYFFANQVHGILTEKNAELLEGYLMIFSGVFIAYVVFSLHNVIHKSRAGTLIKAHQKLQERVFDFSLFSTIAFLVVREGFEIALFTASTSLFSVFIQNFIGLMLGFISASILGIMTFFAYVKF
ncbi:MAG: FTR1 family protein, partial [Patescibacteria group bacterium]